MRRSGLTIVEMLTVVAVLTGIAFPVYGAVRRRAQHAVCADNLHQLGLAVTLYANDHEGWVPPATTGEFQWVARKGISIADVKASPELLRAALRSYVKNEAVWFCPADPKAQRDDLWLGQRHLVTSYFFYPATPGELPTWPPRMQLGRDPFQGRDGKGEDVPLFCDAARLPWMDSDPPVENGGRATSNHPDALVNAIRHDLSLSRLPANEWLGTKE